MGRGLEAVGDGWLFSALFVWCIPGAADGRGSNQPDQMKADTAR